MYKNTLEYTTDFKFSSVYENVDVVAACWRMKQLELPVDGIWYLL